MDILSEEILDLWRKLNKHNVSYIMIGGFAVNLYGYNRTTVDIDLWLKDTLDNRKNFRAALKAMDIGDFQAIETMDLVPGWSSFKLNSGFELDIMTYIKGFEQVKYDECYSISPIAMIEDVPVKFLHFNKLIEAKKASGRPQDLLDIENLLRIKKGD